MTAPWLALPDPPLPGPETLPARAEVVVVGAGAAGAAVGAYLARGGARVVLLEARDRVGAGGSGLGPGVLFPGLAEPLHRTRYALGAARTAELVRFGLRSVTLVRDVAPVAPGGVWVALDAREEAGLRDDLAAWAEAGVDARWWTADAVADALGTPLGPGIAFAHDGVVDPHAVVVALVADAVAHGASAHVAATVTGIGHAADGVHVAVGDRSIVAEVVVLCAGTALPALDPWFEDKITPVREAALATGPAGRGGGLGWRAQQGWLTWRATADGGLVARGARWATPNLEVGEAVPREVPAVQQRLEALVRERLAVDAPVTARWSWIEAHTCDNLPIVGPLPGGVRFLCCAGFAGNSLGLALAAARGVADGLLTGRSDAPAWLAPSRFL